MKLRNRLIETTIQDALKRSGGILITGPKACGKTVVAEKYSKSAVNLETDERVQFARETTPEIFLDGDTPHLIDEWQILPEIWSHVRHAIDKRHAKGQFILTGSSTPREDSATHSGAGRIAKIRMRPFTWSEMGWSNNSVSFTSLLKSQNQPIETFDSGIKINEVLHRIVVGGWPNNLDLSESQAHQNNVDYINLLTEVDLRRVEGVSHDPFRVLRMLMSYSRNISTAAKITTITDDTNSLGDDVVITAETVSIYRNALQRLMIIEDLPAWSPKIRSSAKLRKSPKRHFVDPSLACAVLDLNTERLIDELQYAGFVFESAVIRDLRIYAENIGATVSYYLDSDHDEVDAIVECRNGQWAAFEIKLGFGAVEEASKSLKRFVSKLSPEKLSLLQSLNIITGTGFSHSREDGINVIPFSCLAV